MTKKPSKSQQSTYTISSSDTSVTPQRHINLTKSYNSLSALNFLRWVVPQLRVILLKFVCTHLSIRIYSMRVPSDQKEMRHVLVLVNSWNFQSRKNLTFRSQWHCTAKWPRADRNSSNSGTFVSLPQSWTHFWNASLLFHLKN